MSRRAGATPRLSIGLPVYNGERYVAAALDSHLRQTFNGLEIVVSDNASTDGTEEICRDFAARDPRVRYVRNERNLGAVANFRRVFELTRAPYFKWASHDDLYEPQFSASCVDILDCNPDVVVAHSATAFIDDMGKPFAWDPAFAAYIDPWTGAHQRPDSPQIATSGSPPQRFWQVLSQARWGSHAFGVMRRAALARTQLLCNFAGSDRAMLAELALLGRFQADERPLYLKRFHANGSWALNQRELKLFLSTDDKAYWRRPRQLRAFFSAPLGKPISRVDRIICSGMVAMHCARIALGALGRKDARNAAHGRVWRSRDAVAAIPYPGLQARQVGASDSGASGPAIPLAASASVTNQSAEVSAFNSSSTARNTIVGGNSDPPIDRTQI